MNGNKVLMLTPEGEEVVVDPKNFDAALEKGLEPALEYMTPEGEEVVVRRKNFDAAEKQGLVMKPLYEAQKSPMPSPGKFASGAAGAANWLPLGAFSDEIAGAIESPLGAAQAIGELFGADYSESPELQRYRKGKQQFKDISQAAWEQEPVSYGVGAGIGVGVPVGGAALATGKGAARVPSIAKTIGLGGAESAVEGVGEAEGDLEALLKGGAQAGLGGAVLGSGGVGVQKLLTKAGPTMGREAGKQAYAATGALKSDINKLFNRTPEEVGRGLLDHDVVRTLSPKGSEAINRRISDELGRFTQYQSNLLSELDETAKGKFETQSLIDALSQKADEARKLPGKGNQDFANRLQDEVDTLRQVYGGFDELGQALPPKALTLTEGLEAKRAFDKAGKYQSPNSQADAVAAAREARKLAASELDKGVAKAGGQEVSDLYRTERRGASLLQDAQEAIEEQKKRDQANLFFGLRESIGGSGGATIGTLIGGPIGGVVGLGAGVGLSKLSRTFGPSVAANMLNRGSKIVQSEGFEGGMRTLSALYGQEAAQAIGEALLNDVNFNNLEQPAHILGSAVLGSDLTIQEELARRAAQ